MSRRLSQRLLLTGIFGLSLCAATSDSAAVQLKPDKIKHFLASMALGAVGTGVARNRGVSNCRATGIGIGFSLMFGAGKEVYDWRYKRTDWEWGDVFWDVVGATTGSMLVGRCR